MMFVHGGGFTVGIKDQYAFVGQVFASYGIATAVINYRLSPKTSYPGHVQDTARAFVWLRQHVAEYGGKADKIFIAGHSAGATLVGMLGSDPAWLHDAGDTLDHVAGVIPISGSFQQSARWGCSEARAARAVDRPVRVGDHPRRGTASAVPDSLRRQGYAADRRGCARDRRRR